MDTADEGIRGLTTKEALTKLRKDIDKTITAHKKYHRITWNIVSKIISFSSEKVLLSGVAYTITLVYIGFLILTFIIGDTVHAHWSLFVEAFILFFVLVANFFLALNEEYRYQTELIVRAEKVVETLDNCIESVIWSDNHYPHLCAPFSPCVTLQWTCRDGNIVNLPWALLVEGDIIILRPGQDAPGHCKGLQQEDQELFFGQTFQPQVKVKENFMSPRMRSPHQNKAYKMCETPYLKNLKIALVQATSRPVTVFEKQRYLCTVKIMEGIALPVVVILVIVICSVRHYYNLPGVTHWSEIYLLLTIASTLPLLQIVYPIVWILLNCYGLARFKLLSEVRQKYVRTKSHSISEDASDPLIQALSESNLKPESLKSLGKTFFNILTGKEDMIARTSNIVHVLGSLSALCCIDKKGILSWPNPTAEKVFFLREASPSKHSSKSSLDSIDKDDKVENGDGSTVAEVLDLTHDQNAPFSVEFDDLCWRVHLPRLKPLGLTALLNTCATQPRHTYNHFFAHITCEALLSEDLVPVTNRRCLCELAKQIGFTESASNAFNVEECLAVFRRMQADTIRRETKFARSLQLKTRVKVPLPHMLSVIVKDNTENLQLLTQGTADIVIDSCVDYWNGRDLTPMTASDRKKIIDFYQRNSLTAYCTAFAYKPLSRAIVPRLAENYLELPADSKQLYAASTQRWLDTPTMQFHSIDSLIFNEEMKKDRITDSDGYFDMQCNQVFIGMVTMQYQAQSDMVELIERLERACIRFVHFSKENELRSRVFSEKMGLESGWNCHISLMSDDDDTTRKLSLAASGSAPSAINTEPSTVKFESEKHKPRHSFTAQSHTKEVRASIDSQQSTDSQTALDACRSLSCLTDSTDHSAPVPFDMSNRAKLPRGISNIRPHIERVDNVPLLVSLFTDCSAHSVRTMVQIMQEYGEVVCVMGSAANCFNMEIFMQADASIAVEPLYPVLCQKMPPYQLPSKCIGPIDLARTLNSLPCSLSITRDADVSLFTLITMSRHYITCLWNSTQFWICSVCFIALLQVGSLLCFLPLSQSVGTALWSCLLVTPFLSSSLAFAPLDAQIMHRAGPRTMNTLTGKMALFVFWCYACKFLPSIITILSLYWYTLRSFCEQISIRTEETDCWLVYPINTRNDTSNDLTKKSFHGWGDDFYDGFYKAQHIVLGLISLHLVAISISFIHRQHSIWQRGFWKNIIWCGVVLVLLLSQAIFSLSQLSFSYGSCENWHICDHRYEVEWPLWAAYFSSPILVFGLNEFIKWQEIKLDDRNQRRARLDFGTKLGMNSPF